MKEQKCVYHGSKMRGLKTLKPLSPFKNKKYVFATENPILAVIFMNRSGSLSANFGISKKTGIVYYSEREKGIFNKDYHKKRGSLYKLPSDKFSKIDGCWDLETASKKEVPVLEEVFIDDIKKYLLDKEKKGELRIIKFKDRLKHFPNDEKKLFNTCLGLIKKYNALRILRKLELKRPDLFKRVLPIVLKDTNSSQKVRKTIKKELNVYAKILVKELGYSYSEALDYVKKKKLKDTLTLTYKDKPMGFLSFIHRGRVFYIQDLDIKKEYQGKEHAGKLLLGLEHEAYKRDIKKIWLHVNSQKQGLVNFYLKHNYKKQKLVKNYYKKGIDAYIFVKELIPTTK